MSHSCPWPYARVLAHRGGGTLAPENTVPAIDVGRDHGYLAVEFDAMLARDEVPVLMHDDNLERTTRAQGDVNGRTAEELAQLDAGGWHSKRFAGTPVPSLSDAIAHCRQHRVWINVEIKPAPGHESRTGTVVAQQVQLAYSDCVRDGGDRAANVDARVPLLSSFAKDAIVAARAAAPALPRGWLVDRVPGDWKFVLESLGCISLHTDYEHLTQALAREIKDAGYWLFCYTVNDLAHARRIFDWGVDAFCTDRIDLIPASFR